MSIDYRKEIDGLRALAVLAVIPFHAGFTGFEGGFIGVDIFFVISGYLITNILLKELANDRFSIVTFYERRARRILPALFMVMACCVPFAWIWMQPEQFQEFTNSLFATVLFASNVLFWKESGYFAAAAEEKPLLHTWSLAVEEQFYIVFPLLLLVLWRFGRNPIFYVTLTIALLSLALSEIGWRTRPAATFYLAPTRAWELLSGSLCAIVIFYHGCKQHSGLGLLGLGLIVVAMIGFDESTPFPSLYALVPVIGTALFILFGTAGTLPARLLSVRPLVGIGLISYSTYLWHQPLFAFFRIYSFETPAPWIMVALSALSVGLGYLSWRFVEQPFRRKPIVLLPKREHIFAFTGVTSALFIGFGILGHITDGMPSRTTLSPSLYDSLYKRQFKETCFEKDAASGDGWFCRFGPKIAKTTVALMGDSHSLAFLPGLSQALAQKDVATLYSGVSGCVPLVDTYVHRTDYLRDVCNRRNLEAFEELATQIDAVVLVARWAMYSFGDLPQSSRYLDSQPDVRLDRGNTLSVFKKSLRQTLTFFADRNIPVYLVHQAPLQTYKAKDVYARMEMTGGFQESFMQTHSLSLAAHQRLYAPVQDFLMQEAMRLQGVYLIDPATYLCPDDICLLGGKTYSNYIDRDHLSNPAATAIVKPLIDLMFQTLPSTPPIHSKGLK